MNSHDLNKHEVLLIEILTKGFDIKKVRFNKLEEEKYFKIVNDRIILRKKGKDFYKNINKNLTEEDETYIKDNISEYRKVFKGLKAGSMGDPKSCKKKLTKWLEENPKYTIEDVIKAAKVYIKSLNNLKYLQRADYFIYKQDKDGTVNSTLSAFIDEVDENEEEWTTNLK